mmetsp:Transcript_8153/g.17717  ORF Transcript_8153/g.17717 Transcript_8153/m.17717 type:complete len:285 (-) Transcript_8153:30-884(-)|eukprot:CAMPEP_0113317036 /NCGR_PEP_ID=MMETSP0010_2-20120614/12091_1 /TAXON_ID=216773 ORGANISM="Corethron hystrix, Strain 308" /NCGR_SAMPLE_ID=MMETSP0010_2 /ASSEMBLY_ACC=CAM_ASM_000155 /LENGTH=284 /DNA_ID=CAMNT_0000173909 /DNA_START=241 /DNA_END=1095 /DNA_ORIENTATION=+ /assembly_acc=CAM_ASM_000155
MPKLIGKAVRVVDHDGLVIEECAGNVATHEDTLSIAHVTVAAPMSEPWLTLDYDEWLCVRKGHLELHSNDGRDVLEVKAGETAFIAKGERFRPILATPDTAYIAVCSPAFTPQRCVREEEDGGDVSARLRDLHGKSGRKCDAGVPSYDDVEVLYHMCRKTIWNMAVDAKAAYFPPTFEQDGAFTHATAVPARLVETGNHFYQEVKGDWICLQLSRSALQGLGVRTVFEEAKPVGNIKDDDHWDWICPHIYGGIATSVEGVVTKVFEIERDDSGKFLSIPGLVDV